MSCLWNVLCKKCPVYEMSCLWNVLSMKCPVYEMSCLWDNLSVKYLLCNIVKNSPIFYMYCLWNVLSLKYPVFFKFLLFSMKCHALKLSMKYPIWNIPSSMQWYVLWNVCLQNVVNEILMKCAIWNVLFIKYPVYEIFCLGLCIVLP